MDHNRYFSFLFPFEILNNIFLLKLPHSALLSRYELIHARLSKRTQADFQRWQGMGGVGSAARDGAWASVTTGFRIYEQASVCHFRLSSFTFPQFMLSKGKLGLFLNSFPNILKRFVQFNQTDPEYINSLGQETESWTEVVNKKYYSIQNAHEI